MPPASSSADESLARAGAAARREARTSQRRMAADYRPASEARTGGGAREAELAAPRSHPHQDAAIGRDGHAAHALAAARLQQPLGRPARTVQPDPPDRPAAGP